MEISTGNSDGNGKIFTGEFLGDIVFSYRAVILY